MFRVATLGPLGTCSEDVCTAYLLQRGLPVDECLQLSASYEEAVALVLGGRADRVVVPAAYRDYHEVTFANLERLRLVDVLYSCPSFVLVARAGETDVPVPARVACHPSPSPLLRGVGCAAVTVPAASNAQAAEMVTDGRADLAITFEGALRSRALRVVRAFGSVDMIWAVFARGRAGSSLGSFWAADLDRARC